MPSKGGARQTIQTIDGSGIYSSRVAVGGRWVFFSGSAVDPLGRVRGVDELAAAYRNSPAAQVRSQTRYMFSQFRESFDTLGITFEDVVQIEQYIKHKTQHDGYLEVSRSQEVFARRRPGSLLLQAGTYLPGEAVVTVNGMAMIPSEEYPGKEIYKTDLTYAEPKHKLDFSLPADRYPEFQVPRSDEAPYSEVVVAGPYVFNTILASDYHTGPREDIKIGKWSSWGNEMRNEATWMVMGLDKKLEAGGTSMKNVVHCTAFLQEMGDLYEMDLVWKKMFPDNPPARTLSPIKGLGQPRIEGAKHHWEGSNKMELQFRTLRDGHGATREVISLPGGALPGVESDAVKVDDLTWIGGQLAADSGGAVTSPDDEAQLSYIFDRIAAICEEAGSSLPELLRVRAFVTSEATGYRFYAKLKELVPDSPPVASVIVVPDALHVSECSVAVDAIAHCE